MNKDEARRLERIEAILAGMESRIGDIASSQEDWLRVMGNRMNRRDDEIDRRFDQINGKLDRQLGHSEVETDTRFRSVDTEPIGVASSHRGVGSVEELFRAKAPA